MIQAHQNPAEKVSCNVVPFIYNHSVVTHHLVSDWLLPKFQWKPTCVLDKFLYLSDSWVSSCHAGRARSSCMSSRQKHYMLHICTNLV